MAAIIEPPIRGPLDIEGWLREERAGRLAGLWAAADEVRRGSVGDAVHLRGLVEISNHCLRKCAYCGISFINRELARYRMDEEEIMGCAEEAVRLGYGTLVLQSGEDRGIEGGWISGIIRRIKAETPLAVTLGLGERRFEELKAWRKAGADRYLLKFETSDPELYRRIHPSLPGRRSDRMAILRRLRDLGYEVGSGVMVGIPGQTYRSLAADIDAFRRMDLDMVGIGPYIPHSRTSLVRSPFRFPPAPPKEQVPATEEMSCKAIALARLACPEANIPGTTALAALGGESGRQMGLRRGANVVMPDMTPPRFRKLYDIYPRDAGPEESGEAFHGRLLAALEALGRTVGKGPGPRIRR